MDKKISVIVPLYNAMPYLTECLDSLVNQDYENKEIILVDSFSTDGSYEECLRFEHCYNSVKLYRINRVSAGNSRNYGLQQACGEYIMFVDADDYLSDSKVLGRMKEKLDASKADICVGNYYIKCDNKITIGPSHRSFRNCKQGSHEFLFKAFYSFDHLSYVWGKLYKKDFLIKNNLVFSDYIIAEDKLFGLQAAAKGANYSFFNSGIYVHRVYLGSVTSKYRENSHLIWLNIRNSLKKTFNGKKIPKKWESMMDYLLLFGCLLDGQMAYSHFDKNLSKVKEQIKVYGDNTTAMESFRRLCDFRNIKLIPSLSYKMFVCSFAFFMRLHLYSVVSFVVKLTVDMKKKG